MNVEGSNLRFYRLDAGMTLRDVAAKTGLSIAHLSEIERGETNMTVAVLRRISNGIGISPADLLEAVPQIQWDICPACDGRGVTRRKKER